MATKKTISNSFVVNTIEDGERGKVGRFFYFAGDFDSKNNEKKFLVNDAQAPFFKTQIGDIDYYYVFNPTIDDNVDHYYTMSEMWEASKSNFNNKPWDIMTNDFKYLITEALFSSFAHLGSAIIKGDWMMSTNGNVLGLNYISDDLITISHVGSNNKEDVKPYTLFSEENPSNDGVLIHNEQPRTEGKDELEVKFGANYTNQFLKNIDLEVNKTYCAQIRIRTNTQAKNYFLKIGESDVGSVKTTQNAYETKTLFFKVSSSAKYDLSVRTEYSLVSGEKKYGELGIDYWKISEASFAPSYAVNLRTGMCLQGYGFSSGAIRRNKVVINDFSYNHYTCQDTTGTDTNLRVLDLDKCGSYVELDGLYAGLQLPLYCKSINAIDANRERARSFVGTKLLIYIINDGGIFSRFKNNDHKNEFCYKVSKENGTIKYHSQSFAVVDGEGTIEKVMEYPQFVELECVTGLDEDGEIIYWKVNTIGKI